MNSLLFVLGVLAEASVWMELSPSGTLPEKRYNLAATWGDEVDGFFIFGGQASGTAPENDVWLYARQANAWTKLSPSGTPPAGRLAAAIVWSAAADGFFMVAGWYSDGGFLNDLWLYDRQATAWTELSPSSGLPPKRSGHRVVWSNAADGLFMFGGFGGGARFNDLWLYDRQGNTWTELNPSGALPTARNFCGMVWSSAVDGFFIFGGDTGADKLNDLWLYDRQGNAWTELSPAGTLPTMRQVHTMAWSDAADGFFIFGGRGTTDMNDLWLYSRQANTWTELSPWGTPPAGRNMHVGVWSDAADGFFMFGGFASSLAPARQNDLWLYSNTPTTTTTATTTTKTTTGSATTSSTTSVSQTTTAVTTTSTASTTSSTGSATTSSTTSVSQTTTTVTTTSTASTTSSTGSTTTSSTTSTSLTRTSSTVSTATSSTVTSSSTTSSSSTSSSISSSSSTLTTTSATSTSSSSTTTLEGAYVIPDIVDTATAQGSVVQATLQSALVALKSAEDSIVQVAPQGTVMVQKVKPRDMTAGLVLEHSGSTSSTDSSAVQVQIPASVVQQAAGGFNLLVSLTQVSQEVSDEMPDGNENGDVVLYGSQVIEVSFIQEEAGFLRVADLEDATEAVYLRFHQHHPVEGDQCAYLDLATNTWSSRGVTLVDGNSMPGNTGPGTWCAATHFSIFALVQPIPFNAIHEPEDSPLNASGATVAAALVLIWIFISCFVSCLVLARRWKPASAGETKIRDTRGNVHVVAYTRTAVIEETRSVRDDAESDVVEDTKKKVLVKWNVDVDAMMRRINTLRGHQGIIMDRQAEKVKDTPTLTKETSKSFIQRSLSKKSLNNDEEENTQGQVVPTQTESDFLGPTTSLWELWVSGHVADEFPSAPDVATEAAPTEEIKVSLDLPVRIEMFEDNAPVSYWSTTHRRMIQGFVHGRGLFLDEKTEDTSLPLYDVRVGVRRQLRHAAPITHLEPSLQVNDSVHIWVEDFREWKTGKVSNCLHSAGIFQVFVFEEEEEGEGFEPVIPLIVLDNVSIERIRRRYAKNGAVMVYRGSSVGWRYGHIVEDVVQDLRPPPLLWSPRSLPSPRPTEDKGTPRERDPEATPRTMLNFAQELPETIVEVKVRFLDQEEVEVIPSYLIKALPQLVCV